MLAHRAQTPALAKAEIDWKALIEAAKAKNTIAAYRKWVARYEDFCAQAGLHALEAQSVAIWLDTLSAQYKVSTLQQALAAVSFYFSLHNLPSPAKATEVRLLMQALRRQKGTAQRQAAPLTPSKLTCLNWGRDVKGVRDKALALTMLAGALRVSEAIALTLSDIEFTPEGVIITLRKSKTDQTGRGRQIAIPALPHSPLCPVRALREYLRLRGMAKGPLFQSIHNGRPTGRPLTRSAVHYVAKEIADRLGLDPSKVSTHSFRAGLATAAAQAGVPTHEIALQTGHKSLTVLQGYIRRANLFQLNPVRQAFGL